MTDSTLTPEQLLQRGTALLNRGKHKQAIASFEEAQAALPDNFDLLLNLSAAYIQDKKFKQAVATLEPLREAHEENPHLWMNLGAAYLGNPVTADDKRQMNAIIAFSIALKFDPKIPHAAYNLGLIYRDRKEFDMALKWFAIARKSNPNDDDAQYWIDQIMQKIEKDKEGEGGENDDT